MIHDLNKRPLRREFGLFFFQSVSVVTSPLAYKRTSFLFQKSAGTSSQLPVIVAYTFSCRRESVSRLTLSAFRRMHFYKGFVSLFSAITSRVGSYGEQAVGEGLISLHFVNILDHPPSVAPYGGSDARLGTNPVVIAIPGTKSRPPIILDLATSRVAQGKARVAMNEGKPMVDGCLLDSKVFAFMFLFWMRGCHCYLICKLLSYMVNHFSLMAGSSLNGS